MEKIEFKLLLLNFLWIFLRTFLVFLMVILWGKNVIMEILKRDEIILMYSLKKAAYLYNLYNYTLKNNSGKIRLF